MIVAGVDVGSATAKAVVLNNKGDEAERFSSLIQTGQDSFGAGERVLKEALEKAGCSDSIEQVDYIIATGYGRVSLSFAHKTMTEITCHAKGVHHVVPSARFVIDIGGQDSKGIKLNDIGSVTNFVMNDKCAAGSGRFLEVMAGVLETDLEDFGKISLKSDNPCTLNSICTIFAESEMICMRAERKPVEDLIAGIHYSIAKRVSNMALSIGLEDDLVFSGGGAKNIGLKKALEDETKRKILIPPEDPQIMGALGAALFAKQNFLSENK
jgi:predicted CoA-substrate-specific enzyme activase